MIENDLKKIQHHFFSYLNEYGVLLNQGLGGNFSIKGGDDLWIKPSGTRMENLRNLEELVRCDGAYLKNELMKESPLSEKNYASILAQSLKAKHRRSPSMETGLHALLPKKYVLHYHSILGLIEPEKISHPDIQWIDFCLPGHELSEKIKGWRDKDILLQKNHGIIIQFDHFDFFLEWAHWEKKLIQQYFPDALETLTKLKKFPFDFHIQEMKFYTPDYALFFESPQNADYQYWFQDEKRKDLVILHQFMKSCDFSCSPLREDDITKVRQLQLEQLRR